MIDRFLHKRRRQRVLRAIARTPVCGSILFVCQGNICRSPYAAASFASQLRRAAWGLGGGYGKGFVGPGRPSALSVTTSSAGLMSPGRVPPEAALLAAASRRLDLSGHVSRMVNMDLVRSAEWIVVMEANQRAPLVRTFKVPRSRVIVLGDLDPRPNQKRSIEDPWNKAPEVFEQVYDRIDRCVREFVRALESSFQAAENPQSSSRALHEALAP